MFSSFPHRHGDATGKPATRDKTRGCRKTSISYETSSNFHSWQRDKRTSFAASPIDTARPRENQRRETRHVGAPKRAFRARLPPIFTLCSFKIDVFLSLEPENLQPQNRCFVRSFRQFSAHVRKCHACHGICTLSPPDAALPTRFTKNTQQHTSKVLRLPRKMTMDTSKVLRLPRKLDIEKAWFVSWWVSVCDVCATSPHSGLIPFLFTLSREPVGFSFEYFKWFQVIFFFEYLKLLPIRFNQFRW